jgi:hypothetical protein
MCADSGRRAIQVCTNCWKKRVRSPNSEVRLKEEGKKESASVHGVQGGECTSQKGKKGVKKEN